MVNTWGVKLEDYLAAWLRQIKIRVGWQWQDWLVRVRGGGGGLRLRHEDYLAARLRQIKIRVGWQWKDWLVRVRGWGRLRLRHEDYLAARLRQIKIRVGRQWKDWLVRVRGGGREAETETWGLPGCPAQTDKDQGRATVEGLIGACTWVGGGGWDWDMRITWLPGSDR